MGDALITCSIRTNERRTGLSAWENKHVGDDWLASRYVGKGVLQFDANTLIQNMKCGLVAWRTSRIAACFSTEDDGNCESAHTSPISGRSSGAA
jgi:hypothetical protein